MIGDIELPGCSIRTEDPYISRPGAGFATGLRRALCASTALRAVVLSATCLGLSPVVEAHTVSAGYENAGPGAITFWYGSYHSPGETPSFGTEGSVRVDDNAGNTIVLAPFTLFASTQPAGLVDGVTNFYATSDGTGVSATNDISPVQRWQGATVSNLTAGSYGFNYIPIANPTATWEPWGPSILSFTSVVDASVLTPPGPTIIDASKPFFTLDDPAAQQDPVQFSGGTLQLSGGALPGNVITVPVSIDANNGFVDTNATSGGFSGVVSGPGGLTITGGGIFSLTATNSFAGGVTVNGATLAINSDAALGDPAGVLTLNNATLRALGSLDIARSVVLSGADSIDTNGNAVGVSGSISGTGSLLASGGGTLTLTGTNSYAGGTSVGSGTTLAVNSDAALGAPGGALTLNDATLRALGSLDLARSVVLSGTGGIDTNGNAVGLSGSVSGNGGLLATGGGTLTLTGTNSYTGGTSVGSGTTLAVNSNAALGASTGTLTLTNATLRALGSLDLARSVVLSGTGSVDTNGNAVGVSGSVSGNGGLLATGGGTLTLTGANSYTGGTSVGSGTTLAVNSNAALGASTGTLTLTNATLRALGSLDLARSVVLSGTGSVDTNGNAVGVSGNVSGNGGLLAIGGGTLTLTGTNSYAGGTSVGSGTTLAVNSDAALGAREGGLVLNGGRLTTLANVTSGRSIAITGAGGSVNTNGASLVLNGPVSFAGSLVKTGQGNLVLNGAARGTADMRVEQGQATVNGSLAATALTIASGATLRGIGTIAAPTTVAGTLAPGNSPGTLSFTAPVTLQAGSRLSLDIDGPGTGTGAGNYSRVVLSGAASSFTANGTLVPVLRGITGAASNGFTPVLGQGFTVVAASGGVLGSFTGIAQPAAGLPAGTRFDTLYAPTTLSLVVTPQSYGNLAAAGIAETPNRRAVGSALDALRPVPGVRPGPDQSELTAALYPLGADQIGPALDRLAGTVYGDSRLAARETARQGVGAVEEQIAARRGSGTVAAATTTTAAMPGLTAWVRAIGAAQRTDGSDRTGYHSSGAGVAIGADIRLGNGVLVGAALTQMHGLLRSRIEGGRSNMESTQAIAYGSWMGGPYFVDAVADLTWGSDEVRRDLGVFGTSSNGRTEGWGGGGSVRAGMQLQAAGWRVEPSVGFRGETLHRSGATETGAGLLGLSVRSADLTGLRSTAALGAARDFTLGTTWLTPALRLGWGHEFGDVTTSTTANFAGAPAVGFTTQSVRTGRDALLAGASVTLTLPRNVAVFVDYASEVRSGYTAQTINGGMRFQF